MAHLLFEDPAEIEGILVPYQLGDFLNGKVRCAQKLFGFVGAKCGKILVQSAFPDNFQPIYPISDTIHTTKGTSMRAGM